MRETLDVAGGKPKLTFYCSTGNYSCLNYSLNYDLANGDNKTVTFTGVTKPAGACLTAIGPATAAISIGVPNNGSYPLVFRNGLLENKVMLVVSDSNYVISGPPVSGFVITRTSLNKIPVGTIWGHITTSPARANAADSIMNALVSYGAHPYEGPVGYYTFYQMYSGIVVDSGYGGEFTRNFIYHYTGDYSSIDSLIYRYKDAPYSDLQVMLYTFDGKQYVSGQH